jgi:hypothetical protein
MSLIVHELVQRKTLGWVTIFVYLRLMRELPWSVFPQNSHYFT